jgi:hypothetical protein
MSHPLLTDLLRPLYHLESQVKAMSLQRLEFEALTDHTDIVTPGGRFYKDPSAFAINHYSQSTETARVGTASLRNRNGMLSQQQHYGKRFVVAHCASPSLLVSSFLFQCSISATTAKSPTSPVHARAAWPVRRK